MRRWLVLIFLCAAGGVSQAQYQARITVKSGSSFTVSALNIRDGRILPETGPGSTSVAMVERVEFRFAGVSPKLCNSMFSAGNYKALESLLKQNVGPVMACSNLPGNLPDYLVWLLRAQYWNGRTADALETADLILKSSSAAHVDATNLYRVLLLIDQQKIDEARALFAEIPDPSGVSAAMAAYLRGRLAFEQGDYRAAIQQVAEIAAFHCRDSEWMPPATELEARIYLADGQPEKAAVVAGELIMAYPGTPWSTLGEQIQKTSTGK